jgi:alkylhydroperoxidase family enzyme
MAKWRHEKAFASWLALSPNNKVSGQRVLSSRTRRVNNRAATTLRLAAMMLGKTDAPLGPSTGANARSWARPRPSRPRRANWPA